MDLELPVRNISLLREVFWVFFFPAAVLWALVARARRRFHKPGYRSSLRVLCVGNIHSGGSGKTPLVAAIADRYRDAGIAILSRGYRGELEKSFGEVHLDIAEGARRFGDEPWMLAQLTHLPVFVGRDRAAAIQNLEKRERIRGVILDDGFQHLRLARDLDIVVIDTQRKLTDAYCLPLGELREPFGALKHAGGIVLTGGDDSAWREFLAKHFPLVPVFSARLVTHFPEARPDERLAAFCGIAHPERFVRSLAAMEVTWLRAFSDHHAYSDTDLRWLVEEKKRVGAKRLVTTDKDYFKLNERFSALGESLARVRIEYDLSPDFWYFLQNRWISK